MRTRNVDGARIQIPLDDASEGPARSVAESPPSGFEFSVIIPTFRERENVAGVVARLDRALLGLRWQAIFVDDDSPDGTAAAIKAIALHDSRIACLRRVGRRGLAGAVVEGALASAAPVVVVMDADGQHDETLIPRMLARLHAGALDLVVASRYVADGDPGLGLSRLRRRGSRLANGLVRRICGVDLTDAMSGFFAIRREVLDEVAPRVSPQGFKVLFDIIASSRGPLRVEETPLTFRPRLAGASKLDRRIVLDYLGLLAARASYDLISPRALIFATVGLTGVAVHLGLLDVQHRLGLPFARANVFAALGAMTSNYLLNNAITYRDRRRRGWALASGYLRFTALCAVGLLVNVVVAAFAHERLHSWWTAGLLGAAAGAAWNYSTTALALW